jgi:hypothetical protein
MYTSCGGKRRRVNCEREFPYERVCVSRKVPPHALCREPTGVSTLAVDAAAVDAVSVAELCVIFVSRL